MTGGGKHVVVTGAGGFIGSRLAGRLLAHPDFVDARFTFTDVRMPSSLADRRVRTVAGDISEPALRNAVLGDRADIVYHLAGVLGGAAEGDYALSRRINIDATLALLEALRDASGTPRVIFTSSIAVFGPPLPDRIDDATPPRPTMTYGAQKLMMETAIAQFSARGWIDGLALRLPGIVARPDADARLKSAFLNTVCYACANGEDYTLPVSPDGATWLLSVPACVDALIHAAAVDTRALGARRAFTLPAQRVSIAALLDALRAYFPESASTIRYAPDAAIEAQFASQPPLETRFADALGFRHDGDLATLVARATQDILVPERQIA